MDRILKALKSYYSEIIALLIYFVLACVVTYPLVLRMSSSVYGFLNDNYGNLWLSWWLKYSLIHHLNPLFTPFVSAPFGIDLRMSVFSAPWLIGVALSSFAGDIFVYNIQIIISFPLTGLAMYWLVYRFTGNRMASFVSGLIFAFSPFHLGMATQYPDLASFYWIGFYALSLFRFDENRTYLNAIICAILFAVTSTVHPYFGVFILILTVIFVLLKVIPCLRYEALRGWDPRSVGKNLKLGFIFLLVAVILALPFYFLAFKEMVKPATGQQAALAARPLFELIRFSIKPWNLFLPSADNPIFGRFTSTIILNHLFDSPLYEQSIYLGVIPSILALFALWYWRHEKDAKKRFAIQFFFVLGVVALLFGLGPYIPLKPLQYYANYTHVSGVPKISNITILLYKVLPLIRHVSRFYLLILLSLGVLAGVGLDYVMKRFPWKDIYKYGLTFTITLLIFLEYLNVPPFHNVDLSSVPEVYQWLAKQPGDFIIVEYPYSQTFAPRSLYYLFYQRIHQKRMVNCAGFLKDDALSWRQKILNIEDPTIHPLLTKLKVKYVIVHTHLPPRTYPPYQPVLPDDSIRNLDIREGYGLALAKKFDDAHVYKVGKSTKEFRGVIALYGERFGYPERWRDERDWRWLDNDANLMVKSLAQSERTISLRFRAFSFARERKLTILVNGIAVRQERISPESKSFVIEGVKLKRGSNTIIFHTKPGSVTIDSVEHNGDMRRVTMAVSQMSIEVLGEKPEVIKILAIPPDL